MAGVVHGLGPLGDEAHALVEAERAGGDERGVLAEAVAGADAGSMPRRSTASSTIRLDDERGELGVAGVASARRRRRRAAGGRGRARRPRDASLDQLPALVLGPGPAHAGRCEPWPGNVKASMRRAASSRRAIRVGPAPLTTRLRSSDRAGGALPVSTHRPATAPEWRNGRRGGLKIRCPQGRVGSSPTSGTVAAPFAACGADRDDGSCTQPRSGPSVYPFVQTPPRCWSSTRNGLVLRSQPTVVAWPWPGSTCDLVGHRQDLLGHRRP